MKIDIFTHMFPLKYMETFSKLVLPPEINQWLKQNQGQPALWDMDFRLRIMDKYNDLVQVLTTAFPSPDDVRNPKDAPEMARIANDEMAEIIAKYPRHFIAGVATLPLSERFSRISYSQTMTIAKSIF